MPLAHAVCFWFVLSTLGRAQTPSASVAVSGVVQDQTGSVLPGATVDLVAPTGTVAQTTVTDGAGTFRFDRVTPGQYELRAGFEGFKPSVAKLRVDEPRTCRPAPRPRSRRVELGDHRQQRQHRSRHVVEQQRRRDHHRPEHARGAADVRQRFRRDHVAVPRRRLDRQRRRDDRRQRHGSQRAQRQRVGDGSKSRSTRIRTRRSTRGRDAGASRS